jgi:hypothetical protein
MSNAYSTWIPGSISSDPQFNEKLFSPIKPQSAKSIRFQ